MNTTTPKQNEANLSGSALAELAVMKAKGQLTDNEFEAARAALLSERSNEPDPAPLKATRPLADDDGNVPALKPGYIDLTGRYASRPKAPAKSTVPKVSPAWFVIPAIVLAVVYFIANLPATDRCKDKIGAFVMSQEFARDRLKSPSTAVFPMMNGEGISVAPNGKCGFNVYAYVDAENGFGATVRTWYSAELTGDENGKTWHLQDFAFEGE